MISVCEIDWRLPKSFKHRGSEAVREEFEDQHFSRSSQSPCGSASRMCFLCSFHLANQCYGLWLLKQEGGKRDGGRGKEVRGRRLRERDLPIIRMNSFSPAVISFVDTHVAS